MPRTTYPSPDASSWLLDLIASGADPFSYDAEQAMGETDCPDGCTTDPDGYCPHGFESAAVSAEIL